MSEVTYYVALPFVAADDGKAPGEPTECMNPNAAVMRAEALSRFHERAIRPAVISATPKLIRKFGEVPTDLSAL